MGLSRIVWVDAARATALGLALAAAGASARAQVPDSSASFLVDAYQPGALPGLDVLNVARTRVPPHLGLVFGAELGWVGDPLELAQDSDATAETARVVDHRLRADIGVGFGLFERFAIAVQMPLVLEQGGSDLALFNRPGDAVSGVAAGDLRIVLRGRFLEGAGFGLGTELEVAVPTGDDQAFMSYGSVRVVPRLLADWHDRSTGLGVLVNFGWHIVPETTAQNLVLDDGFEWAVGLDLPTPAKSIHVEASLFGTVPVSTDRNPASPGQAQDDGRTAPIELVAVQSAHLGDMVPRGRRRRRAHARHRRARVARADVAGLRAGRAAHHRQRQGRHPRSARRLSQGGRGQGRLRGRGRLPRPRRRRRWRDGPVRLLPARPRGQGRVRGRRRLPRPRHDHDGIADTADMPERAWRTADGFADDDGCADPDNDQDGVLDVLDALPDALGFGIAATRRRPRIATRRGRLPRRRAEVCARHARRSRSSTRSSSIPTRRPSSRGGAGLLDEVAARGAARGESPRSARQRRGPHRLGGRARLQRQAVAGARRAGRLVSSARSVRRRRRPWPRASASASAHRHRPGRQARAGHGHEPARRVHHHRGRRASRRTPTRPSSSKVRGRRPDPTADAGRRCGDRRARGAARTRSAPVAGRAATRRRT
ncbi:MAG: hypothetical protein U1F43_34410 [Myxococcota bacterium]